MAFDPRMEESWDEELRDTLQNTLGSSEQVVVAFFVEKSTSSWGIGGRRTNLTSKQRILALTGNSFFFMTTGSHFMVQPCILLDSLVTADLSRIYLL
jgi:hypothetical protein